MQNSQEPISDEGEIDIREYVNILLRRRKIFLTAFAVVFLGVALYTFLMKPVYQATASFHVQNEKMTGGVLQDLLLSQEDPVETEMEIIQSRSNAEKVIRKVHLDWGISKVSDGLGVKILDFTTKEKPGYGDQFDYKVELTGNGGYRVWDNDGIFGHGALVGEGKSGHLMQGKGINLLMNILSGRAGDSFRLSLYSFSDSVEKFGKDLEVQEAGTNSDIVTVSYPNTDPELARRVVDTLLQVYMAQNVGFKNAEGLKTAEFIDNQLDKVRKELDTSERNLKDYKSSVRIVNLDADGQQLIGLIAAAETQRAGDALRRKQLEFAVAALKDAIRSGKVYSPSVLQDDPLVAELAGKLADLETQKRGLLSQYTENHPDVRTVEEQIGELQQKILNTYETALNNVSKNEAGVIQLLTSYEGKMSQLPETERQLAKLVRDEKVGADTYTFLLQQGEQARIAAASTLGNIAIIDPAETAEKPIKPKPLLYLLLGFIVASMCGILLAFVSEYMDDTIKDSDTMKRVFGAPLLAVIPYLYSEGQRNNGKKEGEHKREDSLVVRHEPKSLATETFRSLRTAVHFAAINRKQRQVFTVTSTFPNEGKSTVVANLATIIAQTGSRTVVIDCDLRRPALHEIFGGDRVPGVSDVLAGDRDVDEVIRNTAEPGLDFISAGTIPPNPAELIASLPMTGLIDLLSDRYDRVIIDAPPVLMVTDAPLLTAASNMVILVAAAGKVSAKAALRAREVLDNVGASVIGVVMNDQTMSGSKGYGYGGYGYGYHYAHYYGEKDPPEKEKRPWWKRILKRSEK
jgi:tyrosine-protein kinase Etk/Wzc